MFDGDRRRRIVCVAGRDDDSLAALSRTREWRQAWGGTVRAVFLTSSDTPPSRMPDADWFQCWAASKTALVLAARDIVVCDVGSLSTALDDALGGLAGLLVCPAPSDPSTEIARVSLRMMWLKAARLQVPLLIARRSVSPRRILVITDGSPRTLPVLTVALELGQYTSASLAYLNASLIPMAPTGAGASLARQRTRASHIPSAAAGSLAEELTGSGRATYGLAVRMARAGIREHADILVIGASISDQIGIDEIVRIAPCSVLAVPCPRARSLANP
jgi:hypothetical protein